MPDKLHFFGECLMFATADKLCSENKLAIGTGHVIFEDKLLFEDNCFEGQIIF